jgi:PAS domain S-box-containing protein
LPSKKSRARRSTPGGASAEAPEATPAAVVGIGASAGGLEALEKLFSLMPADAGLAFVVIQHLERRHPSLLPELLARHTRMPVTKAEHGMRPEPDHVYVIAPNTVLTIAQGVLRVAPVEEGSPARIDAFFHSLAEDRGERAIGVLLSGAGMDGTAGFRVIKEHGGVAIAQDPRTAKHGSMPRTAIEAGLVDEVLGVEQIPAAVVAHVRHLTSTQLPQGSTLDADIASSVPGICALLQRRTGHDFSGYKEPTLLRRIRRRIHVRHAASAAEYLEILEQDPAEPQRLLKDLLIGVTQFFRDPETFDKLQGEILPRILRDRPGEGPVRIWVPGCASGEEAYSIAILLHEHLAAEQGLGRLLQIFATDIDAEMIAEARAGRYPADIEERVSPERLERYFLREPTGWRVGKDLREMCIFSVHSLIRDPPFSTLDLISCRNVLIYLEPDLQRRVIPLFHYALRRGGHLLLGPAEGILHHPELFEPVDKKHRIYRRRETVARVQVDFPVSPRSAPRAAEPSAPGPTSQQKVTAAIERMLLDEYAPPCAVVNVRGDIQFVAGRIGRFFAPPAGAPPTNVLEAFRESLRVELRSALQSAVATGARVVRDGVPVEIEDDVRRVRLTVRPVPGGDGLFAVVVQERVPEAASAPEGAEATALPVALEQMEVELRHTRADLRAAVESAEAANEELRSANEELVSTNEELQSANEELQTSKEELQSLNEELETVNAELCRNVDELATANGDMQNLFASTDIATLFLDAELRVARFTPAATALFRLIEGDVGRPISDLAPRFEGQDIVADAREVLRTGSPVERQVRAADRPAWFVLRVLPYRTVEGAVAGVVVTFLDFTELKQAEEALLAARERAEWLASFPARNPVPIVEVDFEGRVAYANAAAERIFPDLRGEGRRHAWLAGWIEVQRVFREEGIASHERIVEVGGASYQQNMYFVPETQCIRIYGLDVTQRERAEVQRERLLAELDATISSISDGVIVYGRSGSLSYMNPAAERILGFPAEVWDRPLSERSRMMRLATEAGIPVRGEETPVGRALKGETVPPTVLQHQRADDSKGWISVAAAPIVTAAGEHIGVVATFSDMTDRYRAQAERERLLEEVQLRAAELDATLASMASGVVVYGHDGRVVRMNGRAEEILGFTAEEWIAAGSLERRAEFIQLTAPDGRVVPLWDAPVPRALRGETTHDVPLVLRTRDGRSTPVLISGAPIRGPGGEIHGAVTALADLTELGRAQDALRESEQRYAAIHDHAPIAIALNRLSDGKLVSVNDAFTKLFEHSREELLGKTSVEVGITDPGSRARVAEKLAREGSVRDFEVARTTRSGAPCVLTLNVDLVTIAGEKHTLTTIQDITLRKRSEEALQRSRVGLSRLADASLRVVRETDLDGMLQAISEAALALTGARLATAGHGYVGGRFIVGGSARAPGAPSCPPGNMFVTDRGGVHLDLVDGPEAIRLTDAQMHAHARWWGLPAEHVPMRGLLGVRMMGRDGQASGMILVTDKIEGDFTEGDETLLRQLGTIASLALQHVEARISLEAADRSKNQFLAMLSHELRNPLAPVRNSLYVLERAVPGGEQARRAQGIIGRQVSHLTRLVDDLLDVTRISRGKIQLQRERIDLGELLRRAAEDHRASFVNGGVDLEVTAPEGALFTVGDRTRLTQVVGNLLENAVKFTPRGGKATLSLEENAPLRQAVVRLRDTGAGIAADMLPRLFQPFTQADTTLDRSKGGLGLGLALVRGLVEMHGGAVSADSDGPDRGAEFTLRLPLDGAAPPAPAPARPEASPGRFRRRMLVIEDNVDAAESLREALQLGGHTVEVAFSGAEGMARARTFHPEVILCDIGLPEMNGYQVARAVRTDPALRQVTLVALTGYAAPDDIARSRAAGFDAHVAKPATLESLEAALSSLHPDELPRGRG